MMRSIGGAPRPISLSQVLLVQSLRRDAVCSETFERHGMHGAGGVLACAERVEATAAEMIQERLSHDRARGVVDTNK